MFKHRLLAVVGFAVGTAIVVFSSPPSFLERPNTYQEPIEPIPSPPTQEISPTPQQSATPTSAPTTSPTTRPTAKPTPSSVPSPPKPVPSSTTIKGDIVAAGKYGDVQVQIVITNGIITSTRALIYPDADSRSSSISALAIPILIEQTLVAQDNSNIQGTSRASYTSAAWIASLQSALNKVK